MSPLQIFAIITGIVYIVIAGFSKKMASQAVDVDPVRMVMGPNGPQQWQRHRPKLKYNQRRAPSSSKALHNILFSG